MSSSVERHHATGPSRVRCVVVTVSDSRTLDTDAGGQTIIQRLTGVGHEVAGRELIADDPELIESTLTDYGAQPNVDAILITGGTGISRRDQTYQTVLGMLTTPLPGYGELFRMLSYQQVGAAAMLSRAVGGLMGHVVVLTMPGSPAAVQLAMDMIILPELSHLVREARR